MTVTRPFVLIVDDEPQICAPLKTFAERHGYEVAVACDCDAMMAVLRERRVDMLMLDWKIGLERGDWVFEMAKAQQAHLATSTAFMTGDVTTEAAEILESYAVPVLRKPFNLQAFLQLLNRLAPPREREDAQA